MEKTITPSEGRALFSEKILAPSIRAPQDQKKANSPFSMRGNGVLLIMREGPRRAPGKTTSLCPQSRAEVSGLSDLRVWGAVPMEKESLSLGHSRS